MKGAVDYLVPAMPIESPGKYRHERRSLAGRAVCT